MKKTFKKIFFCLMSLVLFLTQYGHVSADTSKEINQAYQFASENGLITQTLQEANMYDVLIRSDMAEILVNYDMKVLGQSPNTGLVCQFNDMSGVSPEIKNYATLACQLGIIGIHLDGTPSEKFNPDEIVTRAEFGTVLSRALYGNMFDKGSPYYRLHLSALKKTGIIKNTIPINNELRGYVMLMLMRAVGQDLDTLMNVK